MDTPGDAATLFRTVWGSHRSTPLLELPALARRTGVAKVLVKAEGERPLANFKSLGATVACMRALARAVSAQQASATWSPGTVSGSLPRLLCASDGNHGLAVAATARAAGTAATVYLPSGTSEARAARIEAFGARVQWIAGTYDDAVLEAADAAVRGEGLLIADTSPDPHDQCVGDVLDGYRLLTEEIVSQCGDMGFKGPSHAFVQAGVGGLAASVATGLQATLRKPRGLIIVEPGAAACVALALAEGDPRPVPGDLQTCAEMLSCGLASAVALEHLRPFQPASILVGEEDLAAAPARLVADGGPASTPTGATGLAGFLLAAAQPAFRHAIGLDEQSIVLLIATEGPVAA